jgi:hypothetical protein
MINLTTPDGRRAAAFAALLGGCGVMTIFAAVGVYIVAGNAKYSFYLALAAHVQILLGLTAFTALFVKRNLSLGKEGVSITDQPDAIHEGDTVTLEKTDGAS